MASEAEDFAESASAAVREQGSQGTEATSQGGVPPEGGNQEPAGDDLTRFAQTLKSLGATPETAREYLNKFAYLQTPQGQQEFVRNYLGSEAGRGMGEVIGRQHLAAIMSAPDGPKHMVNMLKEWGVDVATPEDETEVPEAREVRAVKAQQAALDRRLQELQQGNAQLQQRLQAREDVDVRRDAFVSWAGERPAMAPKAYAAVANRANELVKLYPDQYRGPQGYKQAASEALNQYTNTAPIFAPKPRPRGLSGGSGGVSGKGGVDTSKLSLKEQISLEAENFAAAVRESEQE